VHRPGCVALVLSSQEAASFQTSSEATILASSDPLSSMYFEISLAVSDRSLCGSHRRVCTRSDIPCVKRLTSIKRISEEAQNMSLVEAHRITMPSEVNRVPA
jgi:hypothetical protein